MANIRFPTRVPSTLHLIGAETLPQDRPWVIKAGFDPTSPDLHLGHAVLLRALRRLQDQGHQVVLVVGDFTARIGDPTGRNTTRPVLTEDTVKAHATTYLDQALRILDPQQTQVRYNSEWLGALSASDLLSLMQSSTVAQLLARHDFAERIRQQAPIGLHELVYPLLQGHDSVVLKCDLEVGGQDQLFNLMAGREAQQRAGQKPQAIGTAPLLVGLDGERKMSKSYGNHIALRDTPEMIFGKVMRIGDDQVNSWAEALGLAPLKNENAYTTKRRLAQAIVAMLHGPQAGWAADHDWQVRFSERQTPTEVETRTLPTDPGLPHVLVAWGFTPSLTVARQKIKEGAVRIDGTKVQDVRQQVIRGQLVQLARRHFARAD